MTMHQLSRRWLEIRCTTDGNMNAFSFQGEKQQERKETKHLNFIDSFRGEECVGSDAFCQNL